MQKNILYFESSSGFGGSSNSLVNLVNHLDRSEFSSTIVIKNFGPKFLGLKNNNCEVIVFKDIKEPLQLNKIKLILFLLRNFVPEIFYLIYIINSKRISIVHINTNLMLGMPAIIASKITATPCICHLRETRELIRREKFILKWVYKFIILNKDAYEVYKKYIPESKLRIVVNGLNLDNFLAKENNKFKKEFNFDTHTLIGVIGRIVKGKGQKEFVLASKKVLQVKPEIGFAIVGDAKGTNSNYYYEEVRTLVKKENLEKNVIFTGWRDDIKNVLAGLDILVLPSTTFPEGLPNSIIEAMALSKPVIATDIPGPRDIVVDGVTGFLVPPGDTKAMAEKIIYLLDNPEIAKKMGEEGRKRVEELFDIKKQVKKIEQVYEEVLSGK